MNSNSVFAQIYNIIYKLLLCDSHIVAKTRIPTGLWKKSHVGGREERLERQTSPLISFYFGLTHSQPTGPSAKLLKEAGGRKEFHIWLLRCLLQISTLSSQVILASHSFIRMHTFWVSSSILCCPGAHDMDSNSRSSQSVRISVLLLSVGCKWCSKMRDASWGLKGDVPRQGIYLDENLIFQLFLWLEIKQNRLFFPGLIYLFVFFFLMPWVALNLLCNQGSLWILAPPASTSRAPRL